MYKTIAFQIPFSLFIGFLFILSSCDPIEPPRLENDPYIDNPSDNGSNNNVTSSVAPSSVSGKKLTFYKDAAGATLYFSAEHYASGGALLSISSTDYEKYPPSYSYKRLSNSTAKYELSFVTKTYIPYYGSYSYSQFRYEMTLTFTKGSEGTYEANYYNAKGLYKTLNGKFTIK